MDSMGSVNALEVAVDGYQGFDGLTVETLMCAVVAMVMLRLEYQRRAGTGPIMGSRIGYAESCKRLLKECAPEAACLVACLSLAAALRARGDAVPVVDVDEEAWEQIKADWPLLLTADTLLSLQTMLRLVVLLSTVFRAGTGGPVPLAEEVSTLWLGGNVARLTLVCLTSNYKLDGPLGGMLPAACEFAVLPILLVLSRGTIRRTMVTLAMVMGLVVCFAFRNQLNLAGDDTTDALFIVAHGLDCLAAFAYLLRTALIERCTKDVSVGFTHMLMPIQAGMAAYYFLVAFDVVPQLVGRGFPFEFLQLSNTVALGAYLGASVLFFAECYDVRAGHGRAVAL